jgi:hypothetical protein
MSITIEEVLTEFKTFLRYHMEDLDNTYYETPIKCENLNLLVDELETLRAQLGRYVVAFNNYGRHKKGCLWKNALPDGSGYWGCDCGFDNLEFTLPTTTQDLIATAKEVERLKAERDEIVLQANIMLKTMDAHEGPDANGWVIGSWNAENKLRLKEAIAKVTK